MRNIDIVMPTSHVRADIDDRAQGNDAPPDHALWEEILRLLEDGPLNDVGIDARRRKILWPDAGPLDLEQSAKHIKLHYVDFPEETIRTFLIYWMSIGYEPTPPSPRRASWTGYPNIGPTGVHPPKTRHS